MKVRAGGLAAIVGSMAFCLALPAFGQTPNAVVNFTGVPAGDGSFGGGYADPYYGSVVVGGTPLVNLGGLIACDDFKDEITTPESWTGYAILAPTLTTYTSAQLATTFFGAAIGLNGYAAVANLVVQDFDAPNNQQQVDLSAAIWWITSGGTISGGNYYLSGNQLDAASVADIQAELAAFGPLGGASVSAISALDADANLWLITPDPPNGSSVLPNGGNTPQEMWTQTGPNPDGPPIVPLIPAPEGGAASLYLLLAGAACFGAMVFSSRNKFGSRETA